MGVGRRPKLIQQVGGAEAGLPSLTLSPHFAWASVLLIIERTQFSRQNPQTSMAGDKRHPNTGLWWTSAKSRSDNARTLRQGEEKDAGMSLGSAFRTYPRRGRPSTGRQDASQAYKQRLRPGGIGGQSAAVGRVRSGSGSAGRGRAGMLGPEPWTEAVPLPSGRAGLRAAGCWLRAQPLPPILLRRLGEPVAAGVLSTKRHFRAAP